MQREAMDLFEAAVIEFASLLKDSSFPLEVTRKTAGSPETVVYIPAVSWVKFQGTVADALASMRRNGIMENGPVQSDMAEIAARDLGSGFNA